MWLASTFQNRNLRRTGKKKYKNKYIDPFPARGLVKYAAEVPPAAPQNPKLAWRQMSVALKVVAYDKQVMFKGPLPGKRSQGSTERKANLRTRRITTTIHEKRKNRRESSTPVPLPPNLHPLSL